MFKKIIKDKRYQKAFFSGFHYGVKHFDTIEDKHFFIYSNHDKEHAVATVQHELYRDGVKLARNYMLYRLELLTLLVLVSTAFMFMFTW